AESARVIGRTYGPSGRPSPGVTLILHSRYASATVTRSLMRTFIARRPGRACVVLLAFTVSVGGAVYCITDGVWWATVTLTTVGHGDHSPESFAGRWLAAFVMLSGIACVAMHTRSRPGRRTRAS